MVTLVKGHISIDVEMHSDREIKEKLEAAGLKYDNKPLSADIIYDRELRYNHLDMSQIKKLSNGEILYGRVNRCAIIPKKDTNLFIPILIVHSEPIKNIHYQLIEIGYRNQDAEFTTIVRLSEPVTRELADDYLKFMNENLTGYIIKFKHIHVNCIEQ